MDLGTFLTEQVYPHLDAVEAGLLSDLNPRRSGRVYYLDCPACHGKRVAYYYPNSAVVRCNRLNNCGVRTSVWDLLAAQGMPAKDIVTRLANAVGLENPNLHRKDDPNGGVTPERKASEVIRHALAAALDRHPEIGESFRVARGWTPEHYAFVRSFGMGYYPTRDFVVGRMKEAGVPLEVAEALDYIRPATKPSPMDNRIVFFWEQANGNTGLIGRALSAEQKPKYRFSANLSKAMPALTRGVNFGVPVYAVEGILDAIAIRAVDRQGIAIGGDHVTGDQARYLAGRCSELVHVVDADLAGYAGAIRTIENCEPLGIHVSIALLPPGSSDPDEIVSIGKGAELIEMLDAAVSSGAYLAGFFLHRLETAPATEKSAVYSQFAAIERLLTPPAAFEYRQLLRTQGIDGDTRPYALRLLASLLDAGLADVGPRNIRRLFRLSVEVSPVSSTGHIAPAAVPEILRFAANILEARLEDELPARLASQFGATLTLKEE